VVTLNDGSQIEKTDVVILGAAAVTAGARAAEAEAETQVMAEALDAAREQRLDLR
jgi:hypothetical protein